MSYRAARFPLIATILQIKRSHKSEIVSWRREITFLDVFSTEIFVSFLFLISDERSKSNDDICDRRNCGCLCHDDATCWRGIPRQPGQADGARRPDACPSASQQQRQAWRFVLWKNTTIDEPKYFSIYILTWVTFCRCCWYCRRY